MYAIVEIAGHQYKVEKDQRIFVDRLEAEEGAKIEFDQVLLTDDEGKVNVGAPAIDGAKVTGKVLGHVKGDKVIVFKKKRRKGYKVRNGHRQQFTELTIEKIEEKGAKKASSTAKKTPSSAKTEETKGGKTDKTTAKKETGTKKKADPTAQKEKTSTAKKSSTASQKKKSEGAEKKSTQAKSKGSSASKATGSGNTAKKSGGTKKGDEKKDNE